jgi:hypothetical protein
MARHARRHRESHRSARAGWLRAAVLGSDDAIVSTASLMIGVAASSASSEATLVAGVAGLVAGAMSMAVGEYVSVSSQRDAEQADVKREELELERAPDAELDELAGIYQKRGLDKALASRSPSSSPPATGSGLTCATSWGSMPRSSPSPSRRRGSPPSASRASRWFPFSPTCSCPLQRGSGRSRSHRSRAWPRWEHSAGTWAVLRSSGPRCASPSAAAWRWR